MAAILCRVCFVEPCKAMAKCCESCCQCLGSCCDCFGQCISSCCATFDNCCNYISSACDKPFSGCLFTAVTMNFVVLIYSIVAILSGGNQCNKPLLILAILLLVCGIINALFSYYVYHTINHDAENPLFNEQNSANMTPSSKLYAFFKYDKWMAAYIIFVLVLIALLIVSITMTSTCSSGISRSVFWIAILLFIYLGLAILILFSYVAFDMFKEWSSYCWCWLIPFCWPCLIIGCCLKTADDYDENRDTNYPGNKYRAPTEQKKAAHASPAPVVVVQQPPAQQIVYAQPVHPQQQVVYAQPVQPAQTVVTVQQPAYNPAAAPVAQPGVFVAHAAPARATNVQSQPAQAAEKKEDDGDYNEIKDKSVKAAKAAGTQAKKAGVAALGWMTKKMNEINDKAQEGDKNKGGEGEEGNANRKTY